MRSRQMGIGAAAMASAAGSCPIPNPSRMTSTIGRGRPVAGRCGAAVVGVGLGRRRRSRGQPARRRGTNTHAVTVGAAGGTINVSTNGQYFFDTADTLLGSGALTVTGNGVLTENVGNLRIAQMNSYSGAVTVTSGGIFEYGTTGAVDAAATFTIANEGELAVQGNTGTLLPNAITVTGGTNSVLSFENGTAGEFSGPIALNADVTVGLRDWYNNATVRGGTISGVISGTGSLTVNSGTGTGGILTLSGANSYSGGTTITSSIILANNNSALGTGAVSISNTAGAELRLGDGVTVGNALTINGGGAVSQGILYVPTGDATYGGAITINGVAAAGGHFATGGGTLTLTGAVTSAATPVSVRLGTVVFANAGNSFDTLNINEGTAKVGIAGAIPVGTTVNLGQSGAARWTSGASIPRWRGSTRSPTPPRSPTAACPTRR